MNTIGERIREAREAKGMSQEDLALACGYKTRSTISKIEKGSRSFKLSVGKKIAKALNVDPDYLIFGDTEDVKDEIRDLFDQLTPEQQASVLQILRAMIGGKIGP